MDIAKEANIISNKDTLVIGGGGIMGIAMIPLLMAYMDINQLIPMYLLLI